MRQFFEKKLQTIINQFLALDPESKERLKILENRIVTIELLGINIIFQLTFSDAKIVLTFNNLTKPDTTIKGTPLSLIHMALTTGNRKKFFADGVSIEGNLDLAQHIIDLFDRLEIDWAEHLSHVTGDAPAHHISRAAHQLKMFSKRLRKTILQNVNEYTHEEINLFPTHEALQDFFQEIDTLRMDTDRLEARITLLNKKLAEKRSL